MQNIIVLFTMAVAALCLDSDNSQPDKIQRVNPILGDISFENKFGYRPDAGTDNDLRIQTHLEFVENLLRNRDVSTLSARFRDKRKYLLDRLHDYWTQGVFPKNYDYTDQRKPCFIDQEGHICAVGYLIEQSAGRQLAEEINNKHQYDELLAMNDSKIEDWILMSGLTKEECAMIQPTYGPAPVLTYNRITPAYGISSSVICGLNLSLNTINAIQIGKGAGKKAAPIIGLITGAGQIFLGSAMFPKEHVNWGGINYTNESQKALSMVNIGLGTSAMILSAWSLIANHKPKGKRTSWNVYGFPAQHNNAGIAFSLTRRF